MFSNNVNKKQNKKSIFSTQNSANCLINLYSREFGILPPSSLINFTNGQYLNEIKLSKNRTVASSHYSVTWLDMEVENRFLLASKSDGNFICIDTSQQKNKCLKVLFNSSRFKNGHSYAVNCIQWYPIDSGMFFTSSMDQKLKAWDTNNGIVVDEYFLKHKIYNHHLSASMSSNTKTLIALALDNGQVRFVDINSGSFTHTLKAHQQSICVSAQWSPYDANLLASAGSDGRIALWDIRSSKSCLMYLDYERTINSKPSKNTSVNSKCVAHTNPIIGLTYTKDGNYIVSLGKDNSLRLWNANNGLNTLVNYGKIQLNDAVAENCLQMSCTDWCHPNCIYVPSGNNVLLLDIFDGEVKKVYKGHFESVNCCYYNPSMNEFYSGSRDRNLLVWSIEKAIINDDYNCKEAINSLTTKSNTSNSSLAKTAYSLMSNSVQKNNFAAHATNSTSSSSYEIPANQNKPLKRTLDNWSDDEDN